MRPAGHFELQYSVGAGGRLDRNVDHQNVFVSWRQRLGLPCAGDVRLRMPSDLVELCRVFENRLRILHVLHLARGVHLVVDLGDLYLGGRARQLEADLCLDLACDQIGVRRLGPGPGRAGMSAGESARRDVGRG